MEPVNNYDFEHLNIYQARMGDVDLVAMLVFDLLKELGSCFTRTDEHRMFQACTDLLEEDTPSCAYLALDGNNYPISVLTLSEAFALWAHGRFGMIMEHFVVPEARSHGIGEKLIQAAVQHGKTRRWRYLQVATPSGVMGQRTQKFYKRNHFKHSGDYMQLSL